MRVHLPVLLALSRQLAVLARRRDGPAVDAHADLPRVPARRASRRATATGTTTRRRSSSWSRSGVIEDYTYLWYDVRPHPKFGTVEIRVCDAQTRVEHTLGAGGADPGDGQGAVPSTTTPARSCRDYPWQMLDENKWLAARHGLDGELVDLPRADRVATKALDAAAAGPPARRTPRTSARPRELDGIDDLLERGNGAAPPDLVYEANHDFDEVMREIVDATGEG